MSDTIRAFVPDMRRARAQAFVEAKLHARDRRVPYPKGTRGMVYGV